MHLLVGLDYRDKQQTNHPIGSNWYSISTTTHQDHTGCISWLDWITEINNKQTTLVGVQLVFNINNYTPGPYRMHLLVGLDYRDKQQTNHPIGSNWYSITATTHQDHTGCISWLDWITEINNKQTTLLDPIGIQ